MENNEYNLIVLKEKYDYATKVEWDGEVMGTTILLEDYLISYLYDNIDIMNTMSNFLEI